MCSSNHNLGHFFFPKSMFTFLKNGVFFSIDSKKGDCEVCLFDKMLRGTQHETRNGQFTKLPIRCQNGEIFPDS